MSKKLIPRKIKKACKAYRNDVPIKTKWLRHVHNQVSGRVDEDLSRINNWTVRYKTKNGEILDAYILFGNNAKYLRANSVKSNTNSAVDRYYSPVFTTLYQAPKLRKIKSSFVSHKNKINIE